MTPPIRFSQMVAAMPDSERAWKARRFEELHAQHPGWGQQQLVSAVESDFTRQGQAAQASARRMALPFGSRGGTRASADDVATQGFAMGWSDELRAGADALIAKLAAGDKRPLKDIYREFKGQEQARLDDFAKENPVAFPLLQIAGGMLSGGAGTGRAAAGQAVNLAARASRGAAAGGVAGVVGGAGASDADSMRGVATDAAIGGGVGAVAGGLLPVLGDAISGTARLARGAARATRNAVRGTLSPGEVQLAPMTGPVSSPMGASGPLALPAGAGRPLALPPGAPAPSAPMSLPAGAGRPIALPAGAMPEPAPAGAGAGAVPPSVPPTATAAGASAQPPRSALDELLRALQRDGISLDDLRGRLASASPQEVLADIAGPNTKSMMAAVESTPSRGAAMVRETLMGRQAGQREALEQELVRLFGQAESPNLTQAARALAESRRAAAGPAYKAAYETPEGVARTVPRSVLSGFMENPVFQEVFKRARRQFDLDQLTGEAPTQIPVFAEAVTEVLQNGQPVVELAEQVPVAVIDYLKRGLDSIIESGMDGRPLDKTAARSLRILREKLLGRVDEMVPEFQQARQTFASARALEDALDSGREALRRDVTADDLAQMLSEMTPGEAEQFRIGALGQLLERVAATGDGRDIASTVAGNEAIRRKMALLLPTDDARAGFEQLLESQARQVGTRRMIQGSRTVPLQQAIRDLSGGTSSTVGAVFRNPMDAARLITGRVGDAIAAGAIESTADDVAPLLMTPRADIDALIERLAARAAERGRRQAAATGARSGVIGATPGLDR